MNVMQVTCGNCGGIGSTTIYDIVSHAEDTIGMAQGRRVVCPNCDGKGWTEYAVFSVDEAKAILKHCGLSTES